MRFSLILLSLFILGIVSGILDLIPLDLVKNYPIEDYLLYFLLLLVGISIGSDTKAIQGLFKINLITILIPLLVALGSIAGSAVAVFIVTIPDLKECMAIGAGFGYYSLSSIIIGKLRGETLAGIALLTNMIREITTLLFAPILTKYFGNLAPIASAGATSMDTTLPVIHRCVGAKFTVISVINGAVLSVLVPIIIPIILG